MTSPENTVHFRSEIQLRIVTQGFDLKNNPIGPERTDQMLVMPRPAPTPIVTRKRDPFSGEPMSVEPPPPARELYLIEDFFDSIGARLPSRGKAIFLMKKVDHQQAEMARLEVRQTERVEILREDHRNDNRRNSDLLESAKQALLDKTAELERWRDYAIALDADRRARNFSVSKKCAALDPRKGLKAKKK